MNDTEEKEVEVEETRKLFQDFLLEIPEDYLIERSREIEKELDSNPDEVPEYTETDLDERYNKLMELIGKD